MKVYKLFNRILILFLIIFNISCSNNDEELKINEEKKKELINRENNLKIQEQKLRDLQIEVENNLQEKLDIIDNSNKTEDPFSEIPNKPTERKIQKKYAFVYITSYEIGGGRIINDELPKTYSSSWTEITEFEEWNKDIEYRFMDQAENNLFFRSMKTITSRKCYCFNSYSEASEYLEKLKNE